MTVQEFLHRRQKEADGVKEREKEEKLRERLKAEYESYRKQLGTKAPPDLIYMASEIAAVKFVYEELMVEGSFADCTDYLLHFANPLEAAVRDWLEDQDYDHHEDLEHALWIAKETELRKAEPVTLPSPEQGVTMC